MKNQLIRSFFALIGGTMLATSLGAQAQFGYMEPSIVSGTYSGTALITLLTPGPPTQVQSNVSMVINGQAKVSLTTNGCTLSGEFVSGTFYNENDFSYVGPGSISGCQDARLNVASGNMSFSGFTTISPSLKVARLIFHGMSGNTVVMTLDAVELVRLTTGDGSLVNGQCGSSNGVAISVRPTVDLCSAGTASSVAGSGPWTWTCAGMNGGASASCSAQRAAAPSNDNFANYLRMSGVAPSATVLTTGASYETGEPTHAGTSAGGGASVWFAWTAPASGFVTIDTQGSDFDTLLAVYVGNSVAALTRVTSNDNVEGTSNGPSRVTFNATAGVDYKIAVDGFGGSVGTANIRIAYGTPAGFASGSCGAANNLTLQAAPTTALCSVGNPSSVVGQGPWSWSCSGQNGGLTTTCSAQRSVGAIPVCSVTPPVATVRPRQSLSFSANCTNSPTNYKWFSDGNSGGEGSPGRFLSWSSDAAGRTHVIHLVATNANGSSAPLPVHVYVSNASASESYQGAWWAGQAENGWGMSFVQHGEMLAIGWYYFDSSGQPVWALVPGCTWFGNFKNCSGPVVASSGAWFGEYSAAQFHQSQMGTASFAFSDANNGTMTWFVGGFQVTKAISRMQFQSGVSPSGIDYSDIWWGGPAENGWGVAIVQQGAALAGVWYTYSQFGNPVWYLINSGSWVTPTTYSGPAFKATSSPLISGNYSAAAFDPRQAGTVSITFTSATTGTLTYTVDGVTQTKAIERLAF
ncbi:MAG: hypothetical protein SF172_00315 [Burkholderiales bacterium]|nr:hypothetical protein [Burkholderiales bacterium]